MPPGYVVRAAEAVLCTPTQVAVTFVLFLPVPVPIRFPVVPRNGGLTGSRFPPPTGGTGQNQWGVNVRAGAFDLWSYPILIFAGVCSGSDDMGQVGIRQNEVETLEFSLSAGLPNAKLADRLTC